MTSLIVEKCPAGSHFITINTQGELCTLQYHYVESQQKVINDIADKKSGDNERHTIQKTTTRYRTYGDKYQIGKEVLVKCGKR